MTRVKVTAQDRKWEAQIDLRTLQEADEIKKSRPRLNAAQTEAKKQMDALRKTAGPMRKTPRKRAPKSRKR